MNPNLRSLQEKWYVPSGLWAQHRNVIAAMAQKAGLNCIRLVWSTEMALRSSNGSVKVPVAALSANPDLQGKGPLQVLDAVIAALAQQVRAAQIPNLSGLVIDVGELPSELGCTASCLTCWLRLFATIQQAAGEEASSTKHSKEYDAWPVKNRQQAMIAGASPHLTTTHCWCYWRCFWFGAAAGAGPDGYP
jgi:hypothetical protein